MEARLVEGDGGIVTLVRAADEEHGDLLAGEPVAQDGVVRALDVVLCGLPPLRALLGRVEVVLQPPDLLAQSRVVDAPVELRVRDRDADEDPEHEREEDGRQRDDVVAEVEHRAGLLPLRVMLRCFWVASTEPAAARARSQGWTPWQGCGWAPAQRDRGPEAGMHCLKGH